MKPRRVFLIVLDSVGVGELPDAAAYGDAGSNTLRSCCAQPGFEVPALQSLGLFNIDGVGCGKRTAFPIGAYGKCAEASAGKDTTTGHWEICGLISETPMPTYPDGFPPEVIDAFARRTGRAVLCNKPYSGTQVIADYGEEHLKTGALIVYTSADSVFQIAAHEDKVPVETLYEYCRIARDILQGKHAVGRVIARPFTGTFPFTRTPRRHDFSLVPPGDTLIDVLAGAGYDVLPVGKIFDIFAGKGLCKAHPTVSNADGMQMTSDYSETDFCGLCFTNLVDFDMRYGHRNDAPGYANALMEFDRWLAAFLPTLQGDDLLFITADHGCDPCTPSTDHSREYIPLLVYGKHVKPVNLGIRATYADIGKTIADLFGVPNALAGKSFKDQITEAPYDR
ncbi:MAG: phosphopentomutase [Clostridia bacterium]|nr:phosphopentomutase [Clostridia bacterium]